MRQVSTASSVQIVPPMQGAYWGGRIFTGQRGRVLRVQPQQRREAVSLFQVPVLGGPPRKVLEEIYTAPAFSPDGTRMAFIRSNDDGDRSSSLTRTARTSASWPRAHGRTITPIRASPGLRMGRSLQRSPAGYPGSGAGSSWSMSRPARNRSSVTRGSTTGDSSSGSATPARWCSMPSSRPAGVGTRTAISGPLRTRPARCAGLPRASTVIAASPPPREGERWWRCATRYGPACGWRLTATAHVPDQSRAPAVSRVPAASTGREMAASCTASALRTATSGSPMPTAASRGN